jgi:hypothetical protein
MNGMMGLSGTFSSPELVIWILRSSVTVKQNFPRLQTYQSSLSHLELHRLLVFGAAHMDTFWDQTAGAVHRKQEKKLAHQLENA